VIRYDSGMTTKIAVSLPDDLVAVAKEAVASGSAASVSAYVAAAMRVFSRTDTLKRFLDDLDDELGPPGPEAEAWAKKALGLDDEE
jgi:Arc/MetJ-type ribon-helix-helix transcriptional regulator